MRGKMRGWRKSKGDAWRWGDQVKEVLSNKDVQRVICKSSYENMNGYKSMKNDAWKVV